MYLIHIQQKKFITPEGLKVAFSSFKQLPLNTKSNLNVHTL